MSGFQSKWSTFAETLSNQSSKSSERSSATFETSIPKDLPENTEPFATSATSILRGSEKNNIVREPLKSSETQIGDINDGAIPLNGSAFAWAGVRADIERRDKEREAAMARQRSGRRRE